MIALALAENSIQLVPDGTLLFHLVLIVLMVALLNVTLLKPINRILEERDRLTRGRLSEASNTLQVVEGKMREYETRLRDARSAGYAEMERERAAFAKEREQKLGQVKAEIANWMSQEKQSIDDQANEVKASLGATARETAREISSQILRS